MTNDELTNAYADIPETLRRPFLAVLRAGRPWRETDFGRTTHDLLTRSAEINDNWCRLLEDILRDLDEADETDLLPEFATDRRAHREQTEASLRQAERARDAQRSALDALERLG